MSCVGIATMVIRGCAEGTWRRPEQSRPAPATGEEAHGPHALPAPSHSDKKEQTWPLQTCRDADSSWAATFLSAPAGHSSLPSLRNPSHPSLPHIGIQQASRAQPFNPVLQQLRTGRGTTRPPTSRLRAFSTQRKEPFYPRHGSGTASPRLTDTPACSPVDGPHHRRHRSLRPLPRTLRLDNAALRAANRRRSTRPDLPFRCPSLASQ